MTEVFGVQGVPAVVHADRGTSMTSKSVAMLLDELEVTRSHSRPRCAGDNPVSQAWNKTVNPRFRWFWLKFREDYGWLIASRIDARFVPRARCRWKVKGNSTPDAAPAELGSVGFPKT